MVLIFSREQSYQPRLYTEIGSPGVGLHKHGLPQPGWGRLLAVFICFPHRGFQVLLVTIISAFLHCSLFELPSLPHGSLGRRFNLNLPSAPGPLRVALRDSLQIKVFSPSVHGPSLCRDGMSPVWDGCDSPLSWHTHLGLFPSCQLLFQIWQLRGHLVSDCRAGYTVSLEATSK